MHDFLKFRRLAFSATWANVAVFAEMGLKLSKNRTFAYFRASVFRFFQKIVHLRIPLCTRLHMHMHMRVRRGKTQQFRHIFLCKKSIELY